jgi:hypothetical protein
MGAWKKLLNEKKKECSVQNVNILRRMDKDVMGYLGYDGGFSQGLDVIEFCLTSNSLLTNFLNCH